MPKTSAIKDIIAIIPDSTGASPLGKATIKEIRELSKLSGSGTLPCKYALVDNTDDKFKIELDYTPAATFDAVTNPNDRLIIHYYPNFRILSEESNYTEFEDYEESDMSTGNWKLPSEWHRLVVAGAIAMLYPEVMEEWEKECEIKSRSKYINAGMKLKSNVGVRAGAAKSRGGRRY